MTIAGLRNRLCRIEARRFETDPALKALSDDELADALRAPPADPADVALADWFQHDRDGPLPSIALDAVMKVLR